MKRIFLILFMIFSFNVFSLSLLDENGKIVNYEDVVKNTKAGVLNYNAYWCEHCMKGLKVLDEFKKIKPNVDVIIIYTDVLMNEALHNRYNKDDYISKFKEIKDYLKKNNYKNFKVYYDLNNEVIDYNKFKSVPQQTIIFDGKIMKDFSDPYEMEDLMYVFRKN